MQPEKLCWWDDHGIEPELQQTDPHTKGTTAVQFILTSNITIHTLDILKNVYINVFSCKDFDAKKALKFSEEWFKGKVVNSQVIERIQNMILEEKEIIIPKKTDNQYLLEYISNKTIEQLGSNEIPNRFVISLTDDNGYFCELGTLVNNENYPVSQNNSIFNFNKREFENTQQFNEVLLIPTGI